MKALDHAAAIADAMLYEDSIIYPYRTSTSTTRQRWTFGSIFPEVFVGSAGERSAMHAECLVRGSGETDLTVRVRFLHFVRREIGRLAEPTDELPGEPAYTPVASFEAGQTMLVSRDEAREREVVLPCPSLQWMAREGARKAIWLPPSRKLEPVRVDGPIAAVIVREVEALCGEIAVSAEQAEADLWRVRVVVANRTPLEGDARTEREAAQRFAFGSAHVVLTVEHGTFVSLTAPPAHFAEAAGACRNEGCWPVLVGRVGQADTMLASPLILTDYPEIGSRNASGVPVRIRTEVVSADRTTAESQANGRDDENGGESDQTGERQPLRPDRVRDRASGYE